MSDEPLVSVVVLNHNRKASLLRTLQSALELEWPSLEWIVVDNASTDGAVDAVKRQFGGQIKILQRESNSVTAGRNQGLLDACGEFLLSIDNDVLLPDKYVIRKAVEHFADYPNAALLSMKIGSPDAPDRFQREHWWHPVSMAEGEVRFFRTNYFPEGAVFFRATAFREAGGYDEDFFMGFEQTDLAIKLIAAGYDLIYCPDLGCIEDDVRGEFARKKHPIHYLNLRNKLWTAWKHFPRGRFVKCGAAWILAAGFRAFLHGYPGFFFRGVREGIFPPRVIREKRNPLPREVWEVYDKMDSGLVVEKTDPELPGGN